MSDSRALTVLELLASLSDELPDKYVLGSAEFPADLIEAIADARLAPSWKTPVPEEQTATKAVGDEWVRGGTSAVLSVPSVTVGERNLLVNPAHPDYARTVFSTPRPFEFDGRLLSRRKPGRPLPLSQA
jgi:RES domain-containing protein